MLLGRVAAEQRDWRISQTARAESTSPWYTQRWNHSLDLNIDRCFKCEKTKQWNNETNDKSLTASIDVFVATIDRRRQQTIFGFRQSCMFAIDHFFCQKCKHKKQYTQRCRYSACIYQRSKFLNAEPQVLRTSRLVNPETMRALCIFFKNKKELRKRIEK